MKQPNNDRPLTIAMISEHGDPLAPLGGQQAGGQNVYVYELARSLSALGVKVDVFTRWENRTADPIVRFATRAKLIRLKAGPRHFISKDKFGPLMPEFIEHFLEYMRASKRQYDLIHTNYYYSGWAGLRLKEILKIPMVATYHSHGLMKREALGEQDSSPDERTRIEQEIFAGADGIVATSPEEKIFMLKHYGTAQQLAIIPPGVNLRRFSPIKQEYARRKLGLATDKKIVVFAGKMEPRKGALTPIEALREIPRRWPATYHQPELYLFSGDPRQKLRKEERERDIRHKVRDAITRYKLEDAIHFMPGQPQDVLHEYYAAADVVVMPSYYEPFGMVAIEAMASGSPVVASDVGGLRWTVEDGITGYHAKPKDGLDFARQVVRILKNPALRNRLGENAQIRARREFGWQGIARKMKQFYTTQLEKGDHENRARRTG